MRLRDEHSALKLAFNAKVEEVKRTNVQLTKIEALLKTKDKMDIQGGGAGYMSSMARVENEKVIKTLYEEKASLEAKFAESERRATKLRDIVEKLKRNEKVLKRRGGGSVVSPRPGSGKPPNTAAATAGPEHDGSAAPAHPTNMLKLQELTTRLGQRLENAEQQLAHVREENWQLKQDRTAKGEPRDRQEVAIAAAAGAFDPSEQQRGGGGSSGGNEEKSRLQREVSDARAKLSLLQTRYDHLEAKARAQTELQQGSYDQLEDYNRRIRELRRALQDVQLEKSAAEGRAARAGELEIEVNELRQQNEKFEDQIKKLCESPFIASAYDKEERMQRLSEFERNEASQQLKIEHLQETARSHHAALVSMKQQCEQLKAEKDDALNELEAARVNGLGANGGQSEALVLKEGMKAYGVGDVDLDELEHALTIVKRRTAKGPDLSHLPLERIDGEDEADNALALRTKVRELYETNQSLQYEVERSEAMLKAQLAINRELHLEIEAYERSKGTTHQEQEAKLVALQAECARAEGRVRTLEAERKQRLYDVRRKRARGGTSGVLGELPEGPGTDDDNESESGLNSLAAELGAEALGADENLVEVWVRGATLHPELWEKDTPTFAIVDFFNFESEATPVLEGRSPQYDFASSYRVVVDDFLLKFFATETLVVEVCNVRGADFELIGRCTIPLYALLTSRPALKLPSEPLVSARDGSEVGTLQVEVRMGKAVDQLWQLYLDQHPEERLRVDQSLRASNPGSALVKGASGGSGGGDGASKLHNELEVVVQSAHGLPPRDGTRDLPPTAFVHFQVLHFPDSFTRAVPESHAPTFDHAEPFPVPTNPQMLALLAGAGAGGPGAGFVEFTVLDDVGDEEALTVGTCRACLKPLATGDSVFAKLPLLNEVERVVGHLSVVVRWKHPFRTESELGPDALGSSDVAELLSRFSPVKDGQVDWKLFLAWADPPAKVAHAIKSIREHAAKLRITDGLSAAALWDHLTPIFSKSDLVDDGRTWALLGNDLVTADELEALFDQLDLGGANGSKGTVDKAFFLHVLDPPTCALVNLEQKVHARLRSLRGRPGAPTPASVFALCGGSDDRVARSDFKAALRDLGFVLVDEPASLQPQAPVLDLAPFEAPVAPESPARTADDLLASKSGWAVEATTKRQTFDLARATREREFELTGDVDDGYGGDGNDHGAGGNGNLFGERVEVTDDVAHDKPFTGGPTEPPLTLEVPVPQPTARPLEMAAAMEAARGALAGVEGSVLMRALEAMDPGRRGTLAWAELKRGLEACGVAGDLAVVQAVAEDHFRFGDGIDYEDFANSLCAQAPSNKEADADVVASTAADFDEMAAAPKDYGGGAMPVPAAQGPKAISISVRAAEVALASATDGGRRPDLRPAFEGLRLGAGVDTVLLKQFLHVVVQHYGDALPTQALRAQLAAFFAHADPAGNLASDGSVNYRAFLVFCDYRPLEPSPAVAAIERMGLHAGCAQALAKLDTRGRGVLSAEAFMDALDVMGYGTDATGRRMPLDAVAHLFGGPAGLVDYRAFLGFALETKQSTELAAALSEAANQLAAARSRHSGVRDVLQAMRKRDGPHGSLGRIPPGPFEEALFDLGIALAPPLLGALMKCFGSRLDGSVDYQAFAMLLEQQASVAAKGGSAANAITAALELSPEELASVRGRAQRAVDDAFGRLGESNAGSLLLSAYRHYDFRGLGVVGMPEFEAASQAAGFPLSKAELRACATPFLASNDYDNKLNACVKEPAVHYERFLAWATPPFGASRQSAAADSDNRRSNGMSRDDEVAYFQALRQRLMALGPTLWSALGDVERDAAGFASSRAVAKALDSCAVDARDNDMLLGRFDLMGDGRVGIQELERFLAAGRPELGSSTKSLGDGMYPGALSKLREVVTKCVSRGIDFRAAFEKHDPDVNGLVSSAGFRQALAELRVNLSEGDVAEIEAKFAGPNGPTEVLHLDLLHLITPGNSSNPNRLGGDVWRHEEKLRQLIKRRFQWWVPGKLRKCFKHFDQLRRGTITETELSDGLKTLKFRLSAEQEHALFGAIDLDGDGAVTYCDLVVFVKDPNHRHVAHRFRSELNKGQVSPSSLKRLLDERDTNASGLVGPGDFARVLQRLGCDLTEDEVRRLTLRFDENEDGNVAIARVMSFVVGEKEAADAMVFSGKATSGSMQASKDEGRSSSQPKVGSSERDGVVATLKRELRVLGKDATDVRTKFNSTLQDFDPRGSGLMETRDFRRGLEDLGFDLTDKEMRALAKLLDKRGEGISDYREFVSLCEAAADGTGGSQGSGVSAKDAFALELKRLAGSRLGEPNWRYVLGKVDRRNRGEVDKLDFMEALEMAGVELPRSTAKDLFESLAMDGVVRTNTFLRLVEGDTGYESDFRSTQRDARMRESVDLDMRDLKRLVQKATDAGLDLLECFEHFDTDRSGDVNEDEFFRGLVKLGLDVGRSEAKQMMAQFPGTQHGKIKYRSFVKALDLDRGEVVGLPDVEAEVRREVQRLSRGRGGRLRLHRAFDDVDVPGVGTVDRREFKKVLELLGFELTAADVRKLVRHYDKNGDGLISYEEFIKMAEGDSECDDRRGSLTRDTGRSLKVVDDYLEGDTIEGLYRGKGTKWYKGKVTRVNRDGTYDLRYDDGDIDLGALASNMRSAGDDRDILRKSRDRTPPRDEVRSSRDVVDFREGDKIEALYRGKGTRYYPGVVSRVNRDGTYDLDFDDGDKNPGALPAHMRLLGGGRDDDLRRSPTRDSGARAAAEISYREGDTIEGLYRGKGTKWYKGKVTRVNRDGTYDLRYDDGDIDLGALGSNVRLCF